MIKSPCAGRVLLLCLLIALTATVTNCAGESNGVQPCNKSPCPINGGWSNMTWPGRCFTQSELNGCKEIVPQSQTGRRVCDSPEPQYGGLPCAGEATVTRDCYRCNDDYDYDYDYDND